MIKGCLILVYSPGISYWRYDLAPSAFRITHPLSEVWNSSVFSGVGYDLKSPEQLGIVYNNRYSFRDQGNDTESQGFPTY